MADTASLIARVKTEGAAQSAAQLDSVAVSADKADAAVTKLTPDVEKLNKTTKQASNDGLAKFRTTAGQVGFQVQDMVVQLQSGTSAFVAIGQQGSQLAGAFGPGGAVLGAVIALASAIGGVLYKSLTETAGSTKDLESAQKQLKETFQQTTSGTLELTDGMIQLTQISKEAAATQLALAQANADLISQQTAKAVQEDAKSWETWKATTSAAISQYDALTAKGADVNATLDKLSGTYEGDIVGVNILSQNIAELSDKFGVNQQQALDMIAAQSAFNKQPTAENARKISDVFTEWLNNTKNLNPELIRLSTNANNNATALENAEKSANAAADAQKKLGDNVSITSQRIKEQNDAIVKNQQIAILGDRERVRAQAAADKEAFAKRDGVTKEQIDAYNAARDTEAQQDIARIDKTEAAKNARIEQASQKRADAQAKRAESEAQRQQKQAQDFLDTLARQNQDELKAINAQEQQKLKEAAKYRAQGALTAEEYEKAKTAIVLQYGQKRQDALDKEAAEEQKKSQQGVAVLASIDPVAKLQLERQKRLAVIQEYESQENAVHEVALQARADLDKQYEDGLAAAAEERFRNQSEWNDMLMDSLDAVGTSASSSIVGLINGTQTASEAMANLGNTILSSVVSGLTQMGVEYLKNVIIGQTASAATIATASATGAAIASAYAPAAALASLASFGENSAPAMAGITTTVVGTQALALTGFREQGGMTNTGGRYLVGERGKPEVIMPAGASRVRTAEQMRQIMGDSNKNNGIPQISIINQTTGRIDSVQQEQDDEDRIRLLIRETVSSDLQDSNSNIAKSRRSSRGQPGMA